MAGSGLSAFAKSARARLHFSGEKVVRDVYATELQKSASEFLLADHIADRAPLLYRDPARIVDTLRAGFFTTAIVETLSRLPTVENFQESHFGEIAAALFAEDLLGLRLLYSKLSLLTAENTNAYKMDLVTYRPGTSPLEFWFGEVKSSHKTRGAHDAPVGHHKSCFASLFSSLRNYTKADADFDLVAAGDRLANLDQTEKEIVRAALLPYSSKILRYFAVTITDLSTRHPDEEKVLATRKSEKQFEVDMVCIDGLPDVTNAVFSKLNAIRSSACSQNQNSSA
jgi:Cap4 SAVED domain